MKTLPYPAAVPPEVPRWVWKFLWNSYWKGLLEGVDPPSWEVPSVEPLENLPRWGGSSWTPGFGFNSTTVRPRATGYLTWLGSVLDMGWGMSHTHSACN